MVRPASDKHAPDWGWWIKTNHIGRRKELMQQWANSRWLGPQLFGVWCKHYQVHPLKRVHKKQNMLSGTPGGKHLAPEHNLKKWRISKRLHNSSVKVSSNISRRDSIEPKTSTGIDSISSKWLSCIHMKWVNPLLLTLSITVSHNECFPLNSQ